MREKSEAEKKIEVVAAELGLTMTCEFVPWSQSRNKDEKDPSLNWKVTLLVRDRKILTCDYSAGCGHCPSYKQGRLSVDEDAVIRRECERGRAHLGLAIWPRFADVLHSLASDADALDRGTFEEWAGDLGYDTDSRKAEAIYRACLEIGLKLRNGLGEGGLEKLRKAVQDY